MYKILIASLIFLLSQVACQTEGNAQQNRPNIVLIISDDHGTDALGSYGNPYIETPNLDGLAREGTRFTSAFATTASCSPSRSVILTGLHNHYNGMYGLSHHPHNFRSFSDVESLPNILTRSGYRTARIGKFHVAPESVYRFEEVLSVGTANDPATIGRSPVEMADISYEFIDEKSEKPFFLLFATDDPHRSNVFTPEGQLTFETYPNPNPFGNKESGYPGIEEIFYSNEEVIVPSYLPDNQATRQELAQYYQSVSRMDQGIGRLIEILKESNQYENTLIIYVSDNGPAFPASKTTLYEPGIRLPLIVKAPEQSNKGLIQNGLVSLVDLTPTILDYAEIVLSESLHGRTFKELINNELVSGWDVVYGSHTMHDINMYYPMRMIRNERYKLIYNVAHQLPFTLALDLMQSPTWISVEESNYFGSREKEAFFDRPRYELYDLENDPNEINNIAEKSEYQELLIEMVSELYEFQRNSGDPRLRNMPLVEHPILPSTE